MDGENGAEGQLEQYKLQRDQVLQMIQEDDSRIAELKDILDSLNELISLYEEDVPGSANGGVSGCFTITAEAEPENQEVADPSSNAHTNEFLEKLVHMQCRAPTRASWGGLHYGNAIVQSLEPLDDSQEIFVRVLFLQPTHRSVLPCTFFLDGKCRFGASECRFSHGELVALSELQPYLPPDFSAVSEGSLCLCKGNDGLWSLGTVTDAQLEAGTVNVKMAKSGILRSFDLTDIVPVDNPDEDDAADSDEMHSRSEYEEGEEAFQPHAAWDKPVSQVSSAFGGWESHTKGVASKLMAKMGFVVGQGLGSRPGGMTEPILAEVFPKGKSLDFCMEMREGKDLVKVSVKKQRRKKKMNAEQTKRSDSDTNIFAIINAQMAGSQLTLDLRKEKVSATSSSSSSKELDIESFKLDDKIAVLQKEISKLHGSLARNVSTDKAAAAVMSSKLAQRENELNALRHRRQVVEKERINRKDKKSAVTF